jgi:endonuclease YncB( thermonuclease family)
LLLTCRAKSSFQKTAPFVLRVLFLLALPLAICSPGSAASIQGKVVDVVDGGSIVVVTGNLTVKVKLICAAAPEKNQAYSDIARQHLADLILNKYVVVRYSLLSDGYLVGQVLAGDMDIGAQMIRDGVAWYDKSEGKRLSSVDQRIYADSQQAAHSERRGLWQDESPVSPWDFRRAQAEIPYTSTATGTTPRTASTVRKSAGLGLSSEDLMGGVVGPGSLAGNPDSRRVSVGGAAGQWMTYQPADRHFSVLIPSDAYEITSPIVDAQGKVVKVSYVVGSSSRVMYFVMWAKGPKNQYTDASMADDAMKNLLAGMNRAAERAGVTLAATPGRNLSLSGYAGKEYKVTGGPAKGVIRVLSKQIGSEREMFMLFVLIPPESEVSGNEFLDSLKISQASTN